MPSSILPTYLLVLPTYLLVLPTCLRQEYVFMPSSVRDVYLAYLLRQWEGSSCIVFTSTCKVRAHRASLHVARHAASTWQNVAMRRPRGRRASSSRQRSLRSASNARRSTHNSRRCSDTMAFLSRPAMAQPCAGAARPGLFRRCSDLSPTAGASACGGEQAQAGVTPNLTQSPPNLA